jgi:hypothetical protein
MAISFYIFGMVPTANEVDELFPKTQALGLPTSATCQVTSSHFLIVRRQLADTVEAI